MAQLVGSINVDMGGTCVAHSALVVGATSPGQVSALGFPTTLPTISAGSGAPGFTAAQGSVFIRTDSGSVSTRMYVNTTGVSTWTAVTTLA